jgi:ferritin-like protein
MEREQILTQAVGRLQSEGSRREFMRLAGMLGGVFALAACGDDDNPTQPTNGNLALNFGQPVDVLKYAFALEALEADFYTKVVANASFNTAFTSAAERTILTDIRDHEVAHREFFKAAITANGGTVPTLSTRYPASVDFASRTAVLATAKTFEDLGVSAYNGAGRYLVSAAALPFLTIAGKVVSVEARHASAIRDLISPNTDAFANVSDIASLGAAEASGLDAKATPTTVLAAAQPFINETITATGL